MKAILAIILILILCIVLSGCTVVGIRNSEEASYKVLFEEQNIQIRLYDSALIAQTSSKGNYKQSSNSAFRQLAGYIFGDNQSQQKIAMTTPVIQKPSSEKIAMTVPVYQQENENDWTMSFVLPAEYTMDTLPIPTNPDIQIVEIPEKKVASIKYTGLITDEKIAVQTQKLTDWLIANEYKIISQAYSAAYDPPWTVPFLRRNEVHIDIE